MGFEKYERWKELEGNETEKRMEGVARDSDAEKHGRRDTAFIRDCKHWVMAQKRVALARVTVCN